MMKNLKQQAIPALLVMLAAQAALAADATCKFYPKQGGPIDGYVAPKPADESTGRQLIDELKPADVIAAQPRQLARERIVLAREGTDTWTIRRDVPNMPPSPPPSPLAYVHGPANLADRWQVDYHRALTITLEDSLRYGRQINIVAMGSCK
jgi:hypothetical protein